MHKLLISLMMLLSFQAFSQVQEYTLNNGLKVLVKEDHRAPVVVSMIWYNVGSADEPIGITGVSHAIEHMMFKGTSKYPVGVFSKTIAALGGQENAFTNNDYTAYYEKLDADHLATSFELEADRMNNLLLNSEEFAKEIKVIQEERRLRTDNNPQALAFERFLATAHLTAPYNHPVIGWMNDLKQMKVEDLKKWYESYYAPNNATLVVVGDVNPEKVHALAERYFSSIAKRPIASRKPQQEPLALGKKMVYINAPAKLPLLLIGYTVPSVKTAKNNWEPYALEIIAGILDAGESARFAKHLVRGNQVATGAEAYYNLYSRYQSQFIVFGAPSQDHQIKDLEKALITELEALKKAPVSNQELQRVKNQIIAQKTFEKDSIFGQAMELGLLETIGLGWKNTETYTKAINEITPEQIQQVAQRYFQENNMTVAELKPIRQEEVRP
ncbi:TPA: insulinase family protein [Legionella pneumophila]|nr:pitrilysin family protein [Legionella pneumophila]HAT8868044.1 insulinase family protein [Legionella pneumophila subsp. pneumophila]HAT7073048.1 insulinase family protein [Legionella pneumophila]HAT8641605.1 insulinase family protein [Legionella pneumophila]HAT8889422.1 insulinase family protein [Legionella pneumophila subsp. pneumophila]HAT8932929.1 insulinase family protein [Legionella pneumophila subsp. pneumophila]